MRLAFAVLLGGVFSAQCVWAEIVPDRDAGRAVSRQCRTCHGKDGYAKLPIAPHIGGEPAAYIAAQLEAFRSGARYHEMMSVVAKGLSDQAIADVSAWYAGFATTADLPGNLSEDDAPELCIGCHGVNGLAEIEDAPNLTGETVMYIDTQLKAFRSGKREHEVMSAIAEYLSDQDIRDAAEWYAGIPLKIGAPEE
ncbi:MAG: cytochrome c4 [Silicimonas sp.]|nr:cytochrome c4 [Silicimonas sp.]